MFDIISKDALRQQIESSSDNKVTVLYDDKGNPSMMTIIPKMTIGDVFPIGAGDGQMDVYASQVHPAFMIYDATGGYVKTVPEIFVGQYRAYVVGSAEGNSWVNARAVSMPGVVGTNLSYYNSTYAEHQQRVTVENKGPNWHQTNAWEYYLLALWAYKNNILIEGNQSNQGYDYNGRTGVVGRYVMNLTTNTGSTPYWTIGEDIVGETTGTVGVIVGESVVGAVTQLEIRDVYNGPFQAGEHVVGSSSGKHAIISNVQSITYEGSGPLTWSHDNKYSGVWGMASYRETIDGLRIRKKEGAPTPSGIYYPMMMTTPGNYYHWDDNRLLSHPVKMSYGTAGAHRLGYQAIDGSGNPINPTSTDFNINQAAQSGNVTSWLSPTALYKSSVTAETRKIFTCLMWDKAVISSSDKVPRDAEGGVVNQLPGGETDMISSASTPWTTDYNGVFSYVFLSRSQIAPFRITYIP